MITMTTTMTAAIYCRRSNEDERAKMGGTTESVERQQARGAEFIAEHGWTVGPTYVDDAVSGTTFARLDGRKAMITDAEAGKFQILVVAEQSRLGRDAIEVCSTIRSLTDDAGIKIVSRTEGEISVEGEQMLMTMFRSYKDAAVPRDTAKRVLDAARERIQSGFVAGAKCFGYDNVVVQSPRGERKKRTPNPEQAAIVVRLFQMYADGLGSNTIRDTLNAEAIPAPRAPKGWSQACIRQMLANPLYVGDVVWGRKKKKVVRGRTRNIAQPEGHWHRAHDESLRIIDDVLWQRVQAQRSRRRRVFPRSPSTGRLMGRPSWRDGFSEHLWPGLAECGCCKGSVRITHRKNGPKLPEGRAVRRLYTCATRDERGPACANDVIVLREKLDAALAQALTNVLDTTLIADALDAAVTTLKAEHATALDRRSQIQQDLSGVQGKIDRLMQALADDSLPTDDIKRSLAPLTARRQALQADLVTLKDADTLASLDVAQIRKDLVHKVSDLKTIFGREVQQSRALLRRLLQSPIQVTPFYETNPTRRGWRFSGTLVLTRLLSGDPVTLLGSASGSIGAGTSAAARARAPRACGCREPDARWPRSADV
jgi:DNA invertase Pin-like site-specific DNA recombinase